MRIDTIQTISKLDHLESDWEEALKQCPEASIHVSLPWLRAWWQSFGDGGTLQCLVAKEGSRIIGIAPLMIEPRKVGPMTVPVLRLIGNDLSPRSHIVLLERHDEVLAGFVDAMLALRWTYFDFGLVPADCAAVRLLQGLIGHGFSHMHLRHTFSVPSLVFDGTWDSYLKGKSQNFRRSLRRSEGKNMATRVACFPRDVKSLSELLAHIREVSGETWKQEEGTSLAGDFRGFQFFEQLMIHAHTRGDLLVTLLYEGDLPVAFKIFIAYNGVLYGLKTGYRQSYADMAPGFHLMASAIQLGFEEKRWTRLDMDGATSHSDWKFRWATSSDSVVSYYVFRTTPLSSMLDCLYWLKKRLVWTPQTKGQAA